MGAQACEVVQYVFKEIIKYRNTFLKNLDDEVVVEQLETKGKFGTVQRPEPVQWYACAGIALALRTDEAVLRFTRAHPLVGRESLEPISGERKWVF